MKPKARPIPAKAENDPEEVADEFAEYRLPLLPQNVVAIKGELLKVAVLCRSG